MKKLQILGTGCAKCEKLAHVVIDTANELGIEYEIEKVKDITEIIKMGIMITPALLVDGEVKVSGKIPSTEEMKEILK